MEEFEKHYDGKIVEKQMQKFWAENQIYKFKNEPNKKLFSIDTPPPTVNGKLHIGHIFSYTQAEIIARYKRMQGLNVYYPFGFDDNGLPSERLVERENNIKAMNLPRSEFCAKCVETTQKYEKEFTALWKSLGFSCDWDLLYSTIEPRTQKISQKMFIDLAKDGNAYTKESPVLWCTDCQTAIAQSELETKDIDSFFHYIKFDLNGKALEIATTRPELLYGVVAIFVNPNDERYKNIIGKKAKVPLFNFEVPILGDEKVALDKGTGAVMCATYGDSTDVEWCEKNKLPYKKVILENGTIESGVPFIGGQTIIDARKTIVKKLEENNLIIKSEKITHTVSVHDRCGREVEIMPSKQWFIATLSQKDKLLELGSKINWNPSFMKSRFESWVKNLKWDWCVSRQRYFGVPIPVWYCAKCGKPHFAAEEDLPVNPLETIYCGECECGSTDFIPEKSVLDTWATSSITPFINEQNLKKYGFDNALPMGLRTQAHEIIRTWAFYSIVRSMYAKNDIPWTNTMICGIVLAKPGEKISKSKGNYTGTPQEIVDDCTADYIRYGSANVKLGYDTFFDRDETIETAKRFTAKLWNMSKFILSHLKDFDPNNKPKQFLPIDSWIIERMNQTIIEAKKQLDMYEIGQARKILDNFFWNDLCDNYIEIVKERLYQPEKHGFDERRSGQHAIYYVLLNILKCYSIYVPHITEYIYQKGLREFKKELSVTTLIWENPSCVNEKAIEFGIIITDALQRARKFKTENGLSMRAEMDELAVELPKEFKEEFELTKKDLSACTSAKTFII